MVHIVNDLIRHNIYAIQTMKHPLSLQFFVLKKLVRISGLKTFYHFLKIVKNVLKMLFLTSNILDLHLIECDL